MIFVTLGTQDKPFTRLLDAVQKQMNELHIQEEVYVQAGYTPYSSSTMHVFDYCDQERMNQLVRECRLLITHGGVGSIMTGLAQGKKIIAAARLQEYGEHTNNHQLQLLDNFEKQGYILVLHDFDRLDEVLRQTETFEPKTYTSNTSHMIQLLEDWIHHHVEGEKK